MSHLLEHRDTYGQAQFCSQGHQGSSDLPYQLSFCEQFLAYTESASSEFSMKSQCLGSLQGRLGKVKFVRTSLDGKN